MKTYSIRRDEKTDGIAITWSPPMTKDDPGVCVVPERDADAEVLIAFLEREGYGEVG